MNRTNFRLAVAIGLLLGPAAASAQFDVGGRLGIGYAGGEYGPPGGTGALSGDLDESLALGIDGAYTFAPGIKVGAYVNYLRPRFDNGRTQGIGAPPTTYRITASVNDIQLGLRVEAVAGDAKLAGYSARPWGALFGGWEKLWFSYDATPSSGTGASLSPSRSFTGWTGGLEGGLEVSVGPRLAAGPFMAFGMGKFDSFSGSGTGVPATAGTTNTWVDGSYDIPSRYQALHTWTTLGIRGRFSL